MMTMKFPADKLDFLALTGVAMLILGSFAPAANVAIYGTVSYWEAAGPEALVMILAAIGAIFCLVIKNHLLAKVSVAIMWAALLWPFLQGLMEPAAEGFLEETWDTVAETTTGWATDIALHFVEITWGTVALALGCLCVTIGAVWKRKVA